MGRLLDLKQRTATGGRLVAQKEILAEKPTTTPIEKVGGFLAEVTGAKAAFNLGGLVRQAILEQAPTIKERQRLTESRGKLADITTVAIKRFRMLPEGLQKKKLKRVVLQNIKQMGLSREQEQVLEKQILEPVQAVGVTTEAILTAAILGTKAPATLVKRVLAGAGLGAAFTGARELAETGEITPSRLATGAAIGAAVPIAFKVAGVGLRFIGSALKRVGSVVTGKGREIIETVLKRPSEAKAGLRGEGADIMKQVGTDVRKAIQQLRKKAQTEFGDDIAKLPKHDISKIAPQTAMEKAQGITRIKIGKKEIILSLKGIKATFTRLLKEHKVNIDTKTGKLNVSQSTLRKSEEKILQNTLDDINNWTDMSAEGIETLAEKIGNYIKPGEQSKHLNLILSSLKKGARKYLGKKIPQFRPIIEKYSKRMDFIDDISSAVSIKGAFESSKGIRQTATKLDNLFGANKELARDVITRLEQETGIEVLGKVAGKELKEVPITGGIGGTIRGLLQAIIPPEAIGEIAAFLGTTKQQIQPFIDGLQKLAPEARLALFNLIAKRESLEQ